MVNNKKYRDSQLEKPTDVERQLHQGGAGPEKA